jgi:hypothetical protein
VFTRQCTIILLALVVIGCSDEPIGTTNNRIAPGVNILNQLNAKNYNYRLAEMATEVSGLRGVVA